MAAWFLRQKRATSSTAQQRPAIERRGAYRQEYRIEALLITHDGRAFEVAIRDLSPLGISFHSPYLISRGTEVTVKLNTSESRNVIYAVTVRGTIEWTRRARVGMMLCGLRFRTLNLTEHLHLIRFFFDHLGLRFIDPSEKRTHVRLSLMSVVAMEF